LRPPPISTAIVVISAACHATSLQYKGHKKSQKVLIPKFSISGSVVSTNCDITSSFDGMPPQLTSQQFLPPLPYSTPGVVRIDECDAKIKCIDLQVRSQPPRHASSSSHAFLQLIRVECCKSDEGDATDSSEIQALQATRATPYALRPVLSDSSRLRTAMCRAASTSQSTWCYRACSAAPLFKCQDFSWSSK
jgi:hypothetical protein